MAVVPLQALDLPVCVCTRIRGDVMDGVRAIQRQSLFESNNVASI